MDELFFPGDAPRGVTSLQLATSAQSDTPSNPAPAEGHRFPKNLRILRSSDFRKVYDRGSRFTCSTFAAFCLAIPEQQDGPKVGFTVTRASGTAVVRNRMKRRMRETIRLQLWQLDSKWAIVFNPRKAILDASQELLNRDVEKLVQQCKNS
jgi:ribonuclease P protein component